MGVFYRMWCWTVIHLGSWLKPPWRLLCDWLLTVTRFKYPDHTRNNTWTDSGRVFLPLRESPGTQLWQQQGSSTGFSQRTNKALLTNELQPRGWQNTHVSSGVSLNVSSSLKSLSLLWDKHQLGVIYHTEARKWPKTPLQLVVLDPPVVLQDTEVVSLSSITH